MECLKVSALILTCVLETLDVSDIFLLKKGVKRVFKCVLVIKVQQHLKLPGGKTKVICPAEQNPPHKAAPQQQQSVPVTPCYNCTYIFTFCRIW